MDLAVEVAEPVHRGALGAGEDGCQRRGHGDVSEGASPGGVFRVVAKDEAAVFALRERVADKEHLPVLIPVLPTQGADLVAPLAQRGERRRRPRVPFFAQAILVVFKAPALAVALPDVNREAPVLCAVGDAAGRVGFSHRLSFALQIRYMAATCVARSDFARFSCS